MSYLPINHHGLIGDLHTAALVGEDGRVVWLPWPRFDSPSIFAALLDHERGGDWLLAPAESHTVTQRYEDETAILITTFESQGGEAELRDWMTPWDGDAPTHDLCRVLRCTHGEIEVIGRFAPRPDYAREPAALSADNGGIVFHAGDLRLTLVSDGAWTIDGESATLRTTLRAGEEIRCVLISNGSCAIDQIDEKLAQTRGFWEQWVSRSTYDGLWPQAVRRSAITLKLLTYAPTGAVVAAPTTSLPEWIGGIRNWDYRYTWLRDASLTLAALYHVGHAEEARHFFQWLDERARQYHTPLQIMYGIAGENDLEEHELEHLEGYRGSRPVRIGNGAYDQVQLDVYGGVVDAAYVIEREGDLLTPEMWAELREEIDYVCAHWHEPDHGIWEMRMPLRHHTFSKLMCWVTLDRGLRIAEIEGWEHDRERWAQTRESIRASILRDGWSESRQAFTMMYGEPHLDASLLIMPAVNFLPGDDPRVVATVERIDEELGRGALVYRYLMDDGLPGEEGAFLLCSFWMVDALVMMGRVDEATERFQSLLSHCGPHGLLSEEVDPASGTALGNYPQAFSHIGLINSAWRLTRAMREREGDS
jgi:GH15 family glucan-1,4-alpha-glucosidase